MTMTIPDLMARWRVSRSTVERRMRDGTLSPIRIGNLIRFRPEEVEAAEEARRIILPMVKVDIPHA